MTTLADVRTGPTRPVVARTQAVMGTVVSYCVVTPEGDPAAAAYVGLARAGAEMERADRLFSLWRPTSPMSHLRSGALALDDAPAEIHSVLERCRLAREITDGWFDPWALPGGLDPTGLVKGWAAACALERLRSAGVDAAMVNAGGDIAVAGLSPTGRPWRVGIRDPERIQGLLGVVEAAAAVATSGTYERGHHIVDPRRRGPAGGVVADPAGAALAGSAVGDSAVVAATVTGAHLDLADALATALVAAGPDAPAVAGRLPDAGYEALVVTGAGETIATPGFPWAE